MSKEELKNNLVKYIKIDNNIRLLNNDLSRYREEKKSLEDTILYILRENNLQNIEIKIPDGIIQYVEKDTTSPLSVIYIKNTLMNYFTEQTNDINTATKKTNHLLKYILDNRQTKKTHSLKRSKRSK
jgi:hypothetical protein